jgi:type II secretory pathway component PulF
MKHHLPHQTTIKHGIFNIIKKKQNRAQTRHFLSTLLKLLKNGIALPEALTLMAEIEKSNKQQTALLEHAEQLCTGTAWDDILNLCPLGWPMDFIHWVKAGLLSSQIIACLQYHLKTLEQQQMLIQRWSQALTYPITVFVLSISLSYFIALQLNSTSDNSSWTTYVFTLLPLLFLFTQFVSNHYLKKQQPGNYNETAWANTCQWLSIACGSGISLPQALLKLHESLPAIWNHQIAIGQCIYHLEQRLRQGEAFGQAIASSQWPQIMHRPARLAEVHADLNSFFEQSAQILLLRHEHRQEKHLKIWPGIFLGAATLGLLSTYLQHIAPLYEQLGIGSGF